MNTDSKEKKCMSYIIAKPKQRKRKTPFYTPFNIQNQLDSE